MPDLFGIDQPTKRAPYARREAAALVEVMLVLKTHPKVAWFQRLNSGAVKIGNRWVKFGWIGAPDIIGQLKDGRFFAVEVKSKTGHPTAEQLLFLEMVKRFGGVAFIARDLRDVQRELGGGV